MVRLLVISLVLLLCGCQSSYRAQGKDGTVGTYSGGRAYVRLSQPVRIQTVIAAANSAMRARGYSIESMDSTAESGKIVGRQPDSADYEKVIVTAQYLQGTVEISVTRGPFGDEELSRGVMDAILQRLGV